MAQRDDGQSHTVYQGDVTDGTQAGLEQLERRVEPQVQRRNSGPIKRSFLSLGHYFSEQYEWFLHRFLIGLALPYALKSLSAVPFIGSLSWVLFITILAAVIGVHIAGIYDQRSGHTRNALIGLAAVLLSLIVGYQLFPESYSFLMEAWNGQY